MRTLLRASVALCLLPLAALAQADKPLFFSHELHATIHKTPCVRCHIQKGTGLPTLDDSACNRCHQKKEIPKYYVHRAPRLGLPFPHAKHVKPIPCLDCHQGVLQPGPKRVTMLRIDGCLKCHLQRGLNFAQNSCRSCHKKDMRLVRPRDHALAWRDRHGQESRARVLREHGRDCQACHRSDACKTCHQKRLPKSHTGLWRVRLHGSAAEWDRQRCQTCHHTGVCVRCHRTTRPLNHRGSWYFTHGLAAGGSGLSTSQGCRVCHSAASCTSCHRRGK